MGKCDNLFLLTHANLDDKLLVLSLQLGHDHQNVNNKKNFFRLTDQQCNS